VLDDDLLAFHILMLIEGGDDDQNRTDDAEDQCISVVLEKYRQEYGGDKPSVEDAETGVEVLQYRRAKRYDDAEYEDVE